MKSHFTPATPAEAADLAAPFQSPPSAATLLPSARPELESIEWLGRDEAIVTWRFADGPPIVVVVTVEYEPADRSVGIMSGGFIADGDAPRAVLDRVAEDASLRAVDEYEDAHEEYEPDDRRTYADERWYEGGGL